MRSPSLIIAATAIALGSADLAAAQEMLNPPAALQEIQVPARILIEPAAKAKTGVEALPSQVPVKVDHQAPSAASPNAATADLKQPSTVLASADPSRLSDTAVGGEVESPAASLNGTLAADAKSTATKCPLKTEMLAFTPDQVAQASTSGPCPRPAAIAPLLIPAPYTAEASPALSIYIPVGYGLDGWSVWGSGGFQAGVREDTGSVGGGGIGVGLGDAKKAVGLELGYTFIDSDSFGEGGFSGKLHRRVGDSASIAFGWNGFANIGRNDFEHSIYGVATYIFRFAPSLDSAFSRLAVTVGAGNGQFRSNVDRDQFENGTNIFGNLAFRVIRPISLIAEWTGQDLALGLSIAPFKNFPFVITPAFRDVTGSGYEPRFVIGAGVSFKF
jgi:hypothetical protein